MRLTMVFYAFLTFLVTSSCLYAANALNVTRGQKPDIFTTPVLTKGTSQLARQRVCTRMRGSCPPGVPCVQCSCPRDRPTFIAFWGECVKDEEVRQIFDSSRPPNALVEYYNGTLFSICRSKRIPTVASKNNRLVICKGNGGASKSFNQAAIIKCRVKNVKSLNETTNGIVPEEKKGNKSTFKFTVQKGLPWLIMKWPAQKVKGPSSLVGKIVLMIFNCQTNNGGVRIVRLIVKIAGQRQWDDAVSGTTETSTASEVATTACSAMNRASSVTTIALAVGGSLAVLISICGVAFLLRRRQRKSENAAAKERPTESSNQTNPTYGRDPNTFMINGELNVADSEENSTYETIKQNTQATCGQTTYETPQDDNVSRHTAGEPVFAPDTNRPQETTEQESQYQPLFKQRTVLQALDRERNQEDTPKKERDYAVLEDPSEDPDRAAGEYPEYLVVEQ